MSLVSAGYAAMTAGMTYFLIVIALPAAVDPEVARVIPRIVAVTAIVAIIGVISLIWSGARVRSWFWLVAVLPGLLMVLLNARDVGYDITHPNNTPPFLRTIVVLAGALAVIVAGFTAFLEVRRGTPIWMAPGRAGWVPVAVVGVVVGAALTSLIAGWGSAEAAGVAEPPTVTGLLTIESIAFVETRLEMRDGETLGLFITNRDDLVHSFDIDGLDIHVQLPPNSTTAVAIKPSGSGTLEFFCAISGHEAAGMVGTIEVKA
jgi:uncharacterized cupredoxin-like copper-binding protein